MDPSVLADNEQQLKLMEAKDAAARLAAAEEAIQREQV